MNDANDKPRIPRWQWTVAVGAILFSGYMLSSNLIDFFGEAQAAEKVASTHAGRKSKIRIEGDEQFLWAKGSRDPQDETSQWFDMTGSPLPLDQFNHGIGRDTIPSIDQPVFVEADDPKFLHRWHRPGQNIDDLPIIGYEHNGVAHAYPIPLLNRHELVNDTVGGKPVTVGW